MPELFLNGYREQKIGSQETFLHTTGTLEQTNNK
jgi:hypothetical protein